METKCWVPNQSTDWTTNQPMNPMTQQLVYRLTCIPTDLPAAWWQTIPLTDILLDHPANWPSYTLTDSCTHLPTYLLTNSPSNTLTPYQLLTNQPTNWSTEWLTDWPTKQEIPYVCWTLKVYYHIHEGPPLVPFLGQMNSVQALLSYFVYIHFNLPFVCWSSKAPLALRCPYQNSGCISLFPLTCNMPCLSHPPWFYHFNNIWRSVTTMKLFTLQCCPSSCYFLCLISSCLPLSSVLEHFQPYVSSCNVGYQVSHTRPNNRQGYSSVCFNIFIFK